MKNPYKLNLSKYSTHNVIQKMIGKNKLVLDIGCNEGYMAQISDNSNKFYGIDYSKEVLKNAKKYYVDVSFYDLNNLKKIPWNIKFDVIVFADVLEHVLFPDMVLSYFTNKYLKQTGKIIISLPNIANWQIRLNLLFGRFNYSESGILDKTHLHLYTFKTAKELIAGGNLKIIEVQSGSSIFGYIIELLPFLKGLLTTSIVYKLKK